MIWNSMFLMTIVDLLIIGISGAALWSVHRFRSRLSETTPLGGPRLLLTGLLLIGAFHLADLVMMFGLPSLLGRKRALRLMTDLHLNYDWVLNLAVVPLILLGLLRMGRALSASSRELQATQAAFQLERAHLDELFANAPEAIAEHDNEGLVVRVNHRFTELFGFTEEEAVGRPLDGLIVPPGKETEGKRGTETVQSGKPVEFETQRQRKDGSLIDVSVLGAPIHHPGGQVGVFAIYRDITERKEVDKALRLTQFAVDHAAYAVYRVREDGCIAYVNEAATRALGYSRDELRSMAVSDIDPDFPPESWSAHWREMKEAGVLTFEAHHRRKDGHVFPVEITTSYLEHERNGFVWAYVQDITDRVAAEETARKLSRTVEQSPTSVLITDQAGIIEWVNPRFSELSGYSLEEVTGKNPRILKSGRVSREEYRRLWETITGGGVWRGELHNQAKDGRTYWLDATISPIVDSQGEITHYVRIGQDVSIRKEYEQRLLHQTNYDETTKLPNRVLALDRLTQAVRQSGREDRTGAVLIINLDRFRIVNEMLGHDAGDTILRAAAERLTEILRASDTLAHLGGDEFLAILPTQAGSYPAEAVAERTLNAFLQPFLIDDQEFVFPASIGIRRFSTGEEDPHVLLREAGAALHRAKDEGGGRYRFFDPEINVRLKERIILEAHLRHAIENGELLLHYQPIVSADSGALVAVEGLLRWTNPELGSVSPDRFIPVAEETGLILPIGEWVLGAACEQAKRWASRPIGPMRVHVNVSNVQFREGQPVKRLAELLKEHDLPATCLGVEITESVLMEDTPRSSEALDSLRRMGVHLSLDDFGTGHSSLSYLKRFPVDAVKIDRSFVRDVLSGAANAALTAAIIGMSHGLGLKVIAEGIENEEQLKLLRAQGCDFIQGYLVSRPVSADELEALFESSAPA